MSHYFSTAPAAAAPAHHHPKCRACNTRFVDVVALRDHLVDVHIHHPSQFGAFATLPLQHAYAHTEPMSSCEDGKEGGAQGRAGLDAISWSS